MQRPTASSRLLAEQLDALRTELVDLAFQLEQRGRLDAADVAISVAGRVGSLREEMAAASTRPPPAGLET